MIDPKEHERLRAEVERLQANERRLIAEAEATALSMHNLDVEIERMREDLRACGHDKLVEAAEIKYSSEHLREERDRLQEEVDAIKRMQQGIQFGDRPPGAWAYARILPDGSWACADEQHVACRADVEAARRRVRELERGYLEAANTVAQLVDEIARLLGALRGENAAAVEAAARAEYEYGSAQLLEQGEPSFEWDDPEAEEDAENLRAEVRRILQSVCLVLKI